MTTEERNDKIGKNPLYPFTTPEGYFGSFKEQLITRIAEEEAAEEPRKRTLHQSLRPYLYIAAAVAGLIVVLNLLAPSMQIFNNSKIKGNAIELRTEEISEEQFQEFLLDDTIEDYWGTVLLKDNDQDHNMTSAR